jgi:HK97 family phage major capsid protein
MTKREKLIERRNDVAGSINVLVAMAERNEDQNKEFDTLTAEFDTLTAEIDRQEKVERINATLEAPAPRNVKPTQPGPRITGGEPVARSREEKLGAFIAALPYNDRQRLAATASDIFQEAQGADGGLILPVDKRELQTLLAPPELVHGKCDIVYTNSNSITVPTDEDPDWSSSIAAEDVAEGGALTEQKSAFTSVDVTLAKKGALVRVTREMLEDVANIGTYITNKLGRKLAWKLHSMALAAFVAAPSKVAIAKTSGAAAGSAPDVDNVQSMWGSMLVQHRQNAVWLANPQLETEFQSYVLTATGSGVFPIYMPPGGLASSPYATLKGRPVLYVEGLPAVGTTGDLMLVDPSTFWLGLKTIGPRIEESIHAEFKNDVVQYRGYVRAVVASKFKAQITRPDATKAGNVITLATRA